VWLTKTRVGHSEAVLSVQFSPDGVDLCSGSGDCTVRVWDTQTQLPRHTLRGHRGWILCIAWSPDGTRIASGSMDGDVRYVCFLRVSVFRFVLRFFVVVCKKVQDFCRVTRFIFLFI
jgi:WD40 repeat protein